jgi:putative nucleotidyltransferase with HDIG domain
VKEAAPTGARTAAGQERPRRLPTLEATTSELLAYLRDPDVSDQRVLTLLKQDVALSSNVLAVANSPFYGLTRGVESLHQAMRVMGFDTMRNLIYAATIQRMFKQGRICEGFNAKCLWYHAWSSGAAARGLALYVSGVDPQRAFLGALLHDVGHLVELQMDRDAYVRCLGGHSMAKVSAEGQANPVSFLEAEVRHFGQDHALLGAQCLQGWKFPEWCVEVVAGHHGAPGQMAPLTSVCALADKMSATLPCSFGLDLAAEELELHAAELGLEMSLLEEVLAQVRGECPPL